MNRPGPGGWHEGTTTTGGNVRAPVAPGPNHHTGSRPAVLPGPPSRPPRQAPAPDMTGLPGLHLATHARPPAQPAELPLPAPSSELRSTPVRPLGLAALAGLLASCAALLLPWQTGGTSGAPGLVGTAFGIGVLVLCAGLLATVVVDLLDGRVRWLALAAAPPAALLAGGLVAVIAGAVSGVPVGVHLALAGVPWPGPVMSGPGVWVFGVAQLVCLVAGGVGVSGWLRGWGDADGPGAASPRRPLAVALCALAAVLVVVISGVILARTAPHVATATLAPTTASGR